MHRLFIAALQAGIAAAILLGLFGQLVVIPTTASDEVDRFPPYAPFAAPYVTVAVVGVVCVQVALAAVWMLLGMVERDAIFTRRAFRWVDTISGSRHAQPPAEGHAAADRDRRGGLTPPQPGTASRFRSGAASRARRVRGPKRLSTTAPTSQVPAMK
ncbi:DUF2975 domain-containing protein [Streptomyces sp. NPDC058534]|uniref:DUF2975 domain-containing protein n=1 Tax=Streptomyces sp. NPDC058534 TaxID=3346541 RepID=UPI0036518A0F